MLRHRDVIRLAFTVGQAVYDRRTELGMSQAELARRAGLTQPDLSGLELGGTVPTVTVLARLARAMDSELSLRLVGETAVVVFRGPGAASPRGASPAACSRSRAPR
jgi:transcriptional regulator with XRE-family HTH domain